MNFFDQIAIPPSTHHLELMNFFLIISLLVFIPFISMVFGASTLSFIFNIIGRKKHNPMYIRFAKDILDKLAVNRRVGLGLGILPAFSIAFVYVQLMYDSDSIVPGTLFFGCILMSIGFALLYRFKTTFQVESVIESLKEYTHSKDLPEDIVEYKDILDESNEKSGRYAFILIFFGLFFFIGGMTLAYLPEDWSSMTNIMQFFIDGESTIHFFYFLSLAGTVAGIAILFFFFIWQGGIKDMDEAYKKFATKFSVLLSFFSVIALILCMFLKFLMYPQEALSFNVFFYTGITFLLLILVGNLLYAIIRNAEVKYASAAFIIMFFAITFSTINDEMVLGNAIDDHIVKISAEADADDQKKLAAVVTTTDINAEEIFNTKCIACHKFDQKVVGPPYNETVPTFNGNVQKLAEFIYSPTKVDPNYPPMPNQGLTKKEATAMAQWLIQQVEAGK